MGFLALVEGLAELAAVLCRTLDVGVVGVDVGPPGLSALLRRDDGNLQSRSAPVPARCFGPWDDVDGIGANLLVHHLGDCELILGA